MAEMWHLLVIPPVTLLLSSCRCATHVDCSWRAADSPPASRRQPVPSAVLCLLLLKVWTSTHRFMLVGSGLASQVLLWFPAGRRSSEPTAAPLSCCCWSSLRAPPPPRASPARAPLLVQGLRLHGCFQPLSREQLRWHVHAHDVTEQAQRDQVLLMQVRGSGRLGLDLELQSGATLAVFSAGS